MTLRLSIENVDRLPDGGPIRIEVKGRGLDLGRDSHLDWSLARPKPKHLGQALRDSLSRRRILASRRLDQRHLRQRRRLPARRPVPLAGWGSAEHRALHHRRFGRRGAKAPAARAAAAEASLDAGLANVWGPVGEAAAPEIGAKRQTDAAARRAAGLSRLCFVPRAAETRRRRRLSVPNDPRTIG